jgi:hypothetical protein
MFKQEVIKVYEGIQIKCGKGSPKMTENYLTCNCFNVSKLRINRKYETRHNARIPCETYCSAYSIAIHRGRGKRKESPHKIKQISKTASLNRYVFNCYIFLNISFKDSPTEFKVKQHIVGLQPRM